jgi:competence protein ComEA
MDDTRTTPLAIPVAKPVAAEPSPLAAWPRSAQLAVAVLLAVGIGFLVGRSNLTEVPRRASDAEADEPAGARLDLNRATRAELALLHGLGPARAQGIDDYRRQHGRFASVDDLRKVSGIGPKTLEKIRPWLFVDDTAAALPLDPEPPPPMTTQRASATTTKGKKEASLTSRVNVNTADAAELQKVPGIGPKTAQRILDERTLRGPFKTVDELRRVPGIGPKTLEKLRPNVVVEAPVAVAGS